jgi:hypothetical protein
MRHERVAARERRATQVAFLFLLSTAHPCCRRSVLSAVRCRELTPHPHPHPKQLLGIGKPPTSPDRLKQRLFEHNRASAHRMEAELLSQRLSKACKF